MIVFPSGAEGRFLVCKGCAGCSVRPYKIGRFLNSEFSCVTSSLCAPTWVHFYNACLGSGGARGTDLNIKLKLCAVLVDKSSLSLTQDIVKLTS